jgi:hypothetical protein
MLWEGQMLGSCKHHNEPLDFAKGKDFPQYATTMFSRNGGYLT